MEPHGEGWSVQEQRVPSSGTGVGQLAELLDRSTPTVAGGLTHLPTHLPSGIHAGSAGRTVTLM